MITFDHCGQGRSEGLRSHATDFDDEYVCDMIAVIDQLAPEGVPVVIVAHSMGGLVATRFVQLHPTAAVALSGPMYGYATLLAGVSSEPPARCSSRGGK